MNELMTLLGTSNGRQLYHISGRELGQWEALLPKTNWLALPILELPDKSQAERIARACLDNDVAYVCTLGPACEMLHDWIDETILVDRVNGGLSVSSQEDFEHSPMTTWHDDFKEGVWFALTVAYDDYKEINAVVCIDMTEQGEKERIGSLLEAINNNWLPSDRD